MESQYEVSNKELCDVTQALFKTGENHSKGVSGQKVMGT